jgi:hypothetical protein
MATSTGASQPACVVSRDTGSLPRGAVGRDGSVACNGGHCVVVARASSLCFRPGLSSFSYMLYASCCMLHRCCMLHHSATCCMLHPALCTVCSWQSGLPAWAHDMRNLDGVCKAVGCVPSAVSLRRALSCAGSVRSSDVGGHSVGGTLGLCVRACHGARQHGAL